MRGEGRGVLSPSEVLDSARSIAAIQHASGAIPSVPGGCVEPWNHVEAAIALDLAGLHERARAAYRFLASTQRGNGTWFASYATDGRPLAAHVDTNATAYVATGLLAHLLASRAASVAAELWAFAERALDAVLARERDGIVPWSIQPDGTDAPLVLLTGSSSLSSSLRHGAVLAQLLGQPARRFREAGDRVARVVAVGEGFADRSEFAMDWYYPVLAGALRGGAGARRLAAGVGAFVTPDGVRCRAPERWVTTAETAEAAIAFAVVGDVEMAHALLKTVADKRLDSGAYLTGLVYPERSEFPEGEASTYSAGAVVIANDLLAGGVAAQLFGSQQRTSSRRLPTLGPFRSSKRPEEIASR